MRTRMIVALVVVATIVASATLHASVPGLINFQGILKNNSGSPLVGSFSTTFSIYDAPTGGTLKWTEAQSVTTDSEGRFNILLGASTPLDDSLFGGVDRYLSISVSPNPEMTPRVRFVTMAYAFHASTVDHTEFDSSNTFVGIAAGNSTMTGINNTANGFRALQSNTSGTQNTANGWGALENNTIGTDNTASGLAALNSNSTGSRNTASGESALFSNTTGNNNTAVGFEANVTSGALTNATAIGAYAVVNASNKIRLGNGDITVIEGKVAYTFTSDKNSKENFQPVDGDEVLKKLRGMNLSSWNYKGHDPEKFRHYGPVAQEFFEAFGHDGVGTSGTPTTINSGDEAGILMIAVQTLSKRNQELESTVQDLAARLERIEGGQSPPQK